MRLGLVAAKLIYTGIVAVCDCLFLLTPFIWQSSSGSALNGLTAFLGGALLALALLNLMADSNAQMQALFPAFPVSYVATIAGILFTTLLPRVFVLVLQRKESSPAPYLELELIEEGKEEEEEEEPLNANVDTTTMVRCLFFVALSLFETFTGNLSVGIQQDEQHLPMLATLIVIGDSVQMIAIGLAFQEMMNQRQKRAHSSLLRLYLPMILLFCSTVTINFVGTAFGIFCSYMLTNPVNQRWLNIASELMLAFNAGMFIKMSMVDMIEVELEKTSNGVLHFVKQTTLVVLGTAFGIGVSSLIAPHP